MTQRLTWTGVAATAAIVIVLSTAAANETARQQRARDGLRADAIVRGMDLYALNCAECHGSYGQGDIQEDATQLDDDYIRAQTEDWLFKAISRGRDDTEMAAFLIDEGGALNRQQIEGLITLIYDGSWDVVAVRVNELGMVSEEELVLAQAEMTEVSSADLVAGESETPAEPGDVPPVIMIAPTGDADSVSEAPPVIIVQPTQSIADTTAPENAAPPVIAVEPTSSGDAPPVILVAPTENASGDVPPPVILVQPTALSEGSLPEIAVVPTEAPLSEVVIVPTDNASSWDRAAAMSSYDTYCASCHGAAGQGTGSGPVLATATVQAMSGGELSRISFQNSEIEGHDEFLSPGQMSGLILLMQSGSYTGE